MDGLILSVGCTNRGKTPITHCYISRDGRKGLKKKKKKAGFVGLLLCELCEQGCSGAVFQGKQRSGSWRFAWGEAPLSVFWQGH